MSTMETSPHFTAQYAGTGHHHLYACPSCRVSIHVHVDCLPHDCDEVTRSSPPNPRFSKEPVCKKTSGGGDSAFQDSDYDTTSGSTTPNKGPSQGSIGPHLLQEPTAGSDDDFASIYQYHSLPTTSFVNVAPPRNEDRIISFPDFCPQCNQLNVPNSRVCGGHYASSTAQRYHDKRSESNGTDYHTPLSSFHLGGDFSSSIHSGIQGSSFGQQEFGHQFSNGSEELFNSFNSAGSRPESISLIPEAEKNCRSICIQDSTGMTPLPEEYSPQDVVYELNKKILTPNPIDNKYREFRDYVQLSELGRGGQGTCYYAIDRKKEKSFAYKMNKHAEDKAKMLSECKILSQLCHDHVVLFLGAVNEILDGRVKLFMELAECGTVESQFKDNPEFQVNTIFIAHLMEQIIQGVNYLHQKCILHRDIKGENVLLFEDSRCKLTDFGLAVHADDISRDNCVKGTCPFVSPEYVQTQVFTYSCDVWSTMAIAVEMMTGKSPWHQINSDSAMMFTIGSYRAQTHFNMLVPEQQLEKNLCESTQPENVATLMYYHQGLLAMMKAVFIEETSQRPSAYDLLRTEIMQRAPLVYDEDCVDLDNTQSMVDQPPHSQPQCDQFQPDSRPHHYGSMPTQQTARMFRSCKSWPMRSSEYREYSLQGRRLSCMSCQYSSSKSVFRRALSHHHHRDTEKMNEHNRHFRRHSLAEAYVVKGPEIDLF